MEGLPKLKATKGKVHECLDMTLDHTKEANLMVKMSEHVAEMSDYFEQHIKDDTAKTPASEWLFTV